MPPAKSRKLKSVIEPIKVEDGRIRLIDQRKIPQQFKYFDATSLDDMCTAIKEMIVRGAPAIGVAAALNLASEAKRVSTLAQNRGEFMAGLTAARDQLQATRPTAVNLRWATDLIFDIAVKEKTAQPPQIAEKMMTRALAMIDEDININRTMGDHGSTLVPDGTRVLTHCNAGALATCGWGTALGVVRSAHAQGKRLKVYANETRPRQQGARLTAWELLQDNIDTVLLPDTAAGYLMSRGEIDMVLVGADRIAANGDTANKIGTYTMAVLARAHDLPFYVVAPLSTIDPAAKSGKQIPIEERPADEVMQINGELICPADVPVVNPAFDVTPKELITAIVTEAGVLMPPFDRSIAHALAGRNGHTKSKTPKKKTK